MITAVPMDCAVMSTLLGLTANRVSSAFNRFACFWSCGNRRICIGRIGTMRTTLAGSIADIFTKSILPRIHGSRRRITLQTSAVLQVNGAATKVHWPAA